MHVDLGGSGGMLPRKLFFFTLGIFEIAFETIFYPK